MLSSVALTVFFLFCSLLATCGQPAGLGTSFMTAFPQLDSSRNMTSLLQFMTRGIQNVTVSIRTLSTSSYYLDKSVQVFPGMVTTFNVPYELESAVGNLISNDAIAITATSSIYVQVIVRTNSNEDFHLLIPDEYLGKEYLAVTYKKSLALTANFILVVGKENDTEVLVDLQKLSGGETIVIQNVTYDHSDVLIVTLHRLHTLQIQTESDLTGTRVTSTKPVAVYSGQNRTTVPAPEGHPCLSHLSDQLPPLTHLGRKFVLVTTPDQDGGDVYRLVATEALTTVVMDSDPENATRLSLPGDFYEYDLESGRYVLVDSDKPILVALITKSVSVPGWTNSTGDPSMAVLTPLEQAESSYVFSHSFIVDDVYLTVVVESSVKDGLRLDDVPLSNYGVVWNPVPATSLVAGYVMLDDVNPRMMTLRHEQGHVFNVHVNSKRNCEARSMPLTYGKPLTNSGSSTSPGTTTSATCQTTTQRKGDNLDNDCDGHVDEESCDPDDNKADDDGDGFTDEDCAAETLRQNVFRPKHATRKRAQSVRTMSTKTPGRCVFACLKQTGCWGVNFLASATLTSDPNCELLSGSGRGRVADSGWRYYEGKTRF